MASQWVLLEDKERHGKRWLKIADTVNKREYSSYFKLSDPDSSILAKFKKTVKEHRKEIKDKEDAKLDLKNFEQSLGIP